MDRHVLIGIATAFGMFIMPSVEWEADNLPEGQLGVFGLGLIPTGFALQSVQYWGACWMYRCGEPDAIHGAANYHMRDDRRHLGSAFRRRSL